MSQFSELFKQSAIPTLVCWFSDPVRYIPIDKGIAEQIEIEKASISDVQVEKVRESDGFSSRIVKYRYMNIVCDAAHADFSGVENPEVGACVEIDTKNGTERYTIDQGIKESCGMAEVKLRYVENVFNAKTETMRR